MTLLAYNTHWRKHIQLILKGVNSSHIGLQRRQSLVDQNILPLLKYTIFQTQNKTTLVKIMHTNDYLEQFQHLILSSIIDSYIR